MKDYFAKDIPGYGPDVPDWYDPEDEGRCITAITVSAFEAAEQLVKLQEMDVKIECAERRSYGIAKKDLDK